LGVSKKGEEKLAYGKNSAKLRIAKECFKEELKELLELAAKVKKS